MFITAGPITKLFAGGGGGEWTTCAMIDDEPRPVWMSGTREEPGTLTQGAPVFPGSSRLGIEPKTPGWLVQDPTTRPIGDLIPTIEVITFFRCKKYAVPTRGVERFSENHKKYLGAVNYTHRELELKIYL